MTLKPLSVAPECAPFVMTGGLADVVGALNWVPEAQGSGGIPESGQVTRSPSHAASPLRIHRLQPRVAEQIFTTWVPARPNRAIRLEDHISQPRIWGALAALYGLTDGDSLPVGSYQKPGEYAATMARQGVDFPGINPVHAMGQAQPDDVIGPYSPSHRAFVNTWQCTGLDGQAGDGSDLVDCPSALSANDTAQSRQLRRSLRCPMSRRTRKPGQTPTQWR